MTQHDPKLHAPSKEVQRAPSAAARFGPGHSVTVSAAKFASTMDKISENVIEERERTIKRLQDQRTTKHKQIADLQVQVMKLHDEVDDLNTSIDKSMVDIASAREAIIAYHKEKIDTP